MIGDVFLWLLSFFVHICLLCLVFHQLMCLSECNFGMPYETAIRVNRFVSPEYFMQAGLCVLFLATGHWAMLLFSLPYLCYNWRLYVTKQHLIAVTMRSDPMFDPVVFEKMQRIFKLGYLVCLLLFSIFWMLLRALQE